MSAQPISKWWCCAILLLMLPTSGMTRNKLQLPEFDEARREVEKLKAQRTSLEGRIRNGEVPAHAFQPYIENLNRRLAGLEPTHHPEARRYWAEQGRDHAQRDIAKGTLRLFFVTKAPRTEGELPFIPPPVDEFESLLAERLGASLVRVQEPSWREPGYVVNYIAVNTRCDGYNAEVQRFLKEQHGFDIVSMLWRMAERDARSLQHPPPDMREVWLPCAASGASVCLLAGLVMIRRRRERRPLQQASDANGAVR